MHPLNPTRLRTIHPTALAQLGEEACIAALGVARDLRSGVIPPEEYDQGAWCGTACCIAGHMRKRLLPEFLRGVEIGLAIWPGLFSGGHPSDPFLAADAIERYVYDGSQMPWAA